MEENIYQTVLDSIINGARFRIDFKSRTLVVNRKRIINNGVYDGNLGIEKAADIQSFLKEVERLYAWYKHSVPSERSVGKQHLYFKALPESELTDEDMLYGRFVCTLRYKYHPAVPVSVGKLVDFVEHERPTLKGKPFRILI